MPFTPEQSFGSVPTPEQPVTMPVLETPTPVHSAVPAETDDVPDVVPPPEPPLEPELLLTNGTETSEPPLVREVEILLGVRLDRTTARNHPVGNTVFESGRRPENDHG